ncbi:MAG: alpha/beta fold hydrolase [Candidatus Nanopelagicales bacterium]|nr:alpha/beta fold hydrolase [Candidatus Nanopelagicales bacterium]
MSTPPYIALPDSVEAVEVPTPAVVLACLRAMPAGEPRGSVVLVPGLTGSKEDFLAIMPLLRDAGWAVMALDLRGQHESKPLSGEPFELSHFASDVIAVMANLTRATGQRIHLLGHSFGGLVARRVVLDLQGESARQEGVELASLTLMASGPAAVGEAQQRKLASLITHLPHTPLEIIWSIKEAMDRAAGWQPPSPSVADFLHRRFTANDPSALRAKALLISTEPDRVIELAAALPDSSTPINVIFGDIDDAWSPSTQNEMAHRLSARRLILPGVGHSPNTERPGLLASALDRMWADPPVVVPSPPRPATAAEISRLAASEASPGLDLRVPVRAADVGGRVRIGFAGLLQDWGLDWIGHDIQLLATELITNAIRHGNEPIHASMRICEDAVRLEVFDSGPIWTAERPPADPDPEATTGRGLHLVASVAQSWGIELAQGGKLVWAELATVIDQPPATDPVPDDPSETPAC